MYYEWVQKYKKSIAITVAILVAISVVWTLIALVSRIGKIPLTVRVVPSSVRVTLGDQLIGNGTTWVKAGTYTVRIEKEGFKTQSKEFVVTTQKKQNVIAIALVAESDDAKKWAREHDREYLAVQEYGAIEANTYGTYIATKHPITKVLPFNDPYYQITYTLQRDDDIALTIATPSPRYRYYAVEKLRNLGFDPTNYRITFKDFQNPLAKKGER